MQLYVTVASTKSCDPTPVRLLKPRMARAFLFRRRLCEVRVNILSTVLRPKQRDRARSLLARPTLSKRPPVPNRMCKNSRR